MILARWRYGVLIVLWVLLSGMPLNAQSGVPQEIFNVLNQARQQQGISLLTYNSVLEQAAQAHSDDMARTENLSHQGSDGSEFWERATRFGYTMTTGAENVLYRFDNIGRSAFDQWRGSASHNANMMNGEYREVGIAYATSSSGLIYFTMVLATGTSIAPAPTNTPIVAIPLSTAIIATQEPTRDPLISTITAPLPTNTLAPFQSTAVIAQAGFATPTISPFANTPTPTIVPDLRLIVSADSFSILNISNNVLSLYGLSFESSSGTMPVERWDTEFLSRPLYDFRVGDCLQVWGVDVLVFPDKPSACKSRNAWVAVNDELDFWRDATSFTVLKDGVAIAECPIISGAYTCDVSLSQQVTAVNTPNSAPVATSATKGGGLNILISPQSVSLVNLSGRALNIQQLAFESDNGVLLATAWESPNLSRSLTAYPDGDCLQVWAVGTDLQDKPENCRYRHAWIAVGEGKQFWLNVSSFRVRRGGEVLATCSTQTPICEVNLP